MSAEEPNESMCLRVDPYAGVLGTRRRKLAAIRETVQDCPSYFESVLDRILEA